MPASQNDAYIGARFTVIRYDAVADDASAGKASDALIGLVATGAAARALHQQNSHAKPTRNGHSAFYFVDWTVDTLTKTGAAPVPQGKVTLTGCIDAPEAAGVTEKQLEIDYSTTAQRWLVSSATTLQGDDCLTSDVTGEVDDVTRTAKNFSNAEATIGNGANPQTHAAGIAKGHAAELLQHAFPGGLAAAGSSEFEVRFIAHYPPDGTIPNVDDAMDVFGCLGSPSTLYFDGTGNLWPPGDFGYLDISHVTTDDQLYVTGVNYTSDDPCDY
ncbi:hypothetical protein ACPPVQ_05880 [Diaminobutyricibacter sp. McL0618]|uniref:hypothetical protein n=1 Tax=Leifsonia sp. McL0618 TaxID=3415677 RepID=UPI003CEBD5A1